MSAPDEITSFISCPNFEKTGREIWLEVDGGVNAENITEIAKAGADTFVAGSAIFGAANDDDPNRYNTVVNSLRASLSKA
jgi:ribulose-phosphate 3-epimerase